MPADELSNLGIEHQALAASQRKSPVTERRLHLIENHWRGFGGNEFGHFRSL